jgi:hypothetical protein
MVKTLFFLEDPNKLDRIIQDSANIRGECTYISLSPGASYAFERSSIPYKSVRDFGGGEERYHQGLENFQRIGRVVTILDEELAPLHGIPSLTPAQYSVYPLKFLFDVLWSVIHNIKTIIDVEQPDFIRIYAPPADRSGRTRFTIPDNNSIYAEVLTLPGWNVPVEIIQEEEQDDPIWQDPEKRRDAFSRLATWFREQDLWFNLGLIAKRRGIWLAGSALYYYVFCLCRKPILIYESGYNWDDSLVELYRGGFVPVHRIKDESFAKAISTGKSYREEVLKICREHAGMREFDQILGIDVSGFFFERLSKMVGGSVQESVAVYPIALRILIGKKIRCLLHSVRERAIGNVIIQAAHDAGIPVVSWQHGGAGYCYHPLMPFIEFINSDWHFVFGEGVAESYRSTSEQIGLKRVPAFIPVGSSSIDAFHPNGKETLVTSPGRPVVYISSLYQAHNYIISQPFDPVNWDEQFWDIQKQVINLAKKHPEKEFIIKLHASHEDREPLLQYVTDLGIKNVKIITSEMTVRELIDSADIVLFDLVSTGILQAFTTNLPVFIYTGLYSLDEKSLLLLKRRAYIIEDSVDFSSTVDEYLRTRHVTGKSADPSDRNFMVKYGTDINAYQSAERAVETLTDILQGKVVFPQEDTD